jgi:hypothetical protein
LGRQSNFLFLPASRLISSSFLFLCLSSSLLFGWEIVFESSRFCAIY